MLPGTLHAMEEPRAARWGEALRWYGGTWSAPGQGWCAVAARLGFVALVVGVQALAGEAAGAAARGEGWAAGIEAHPWLLLVALAGAAAYGRLELQPGVRAREHGDRLRALARVLAWGAALVAARWPGWLDAGAVRLVWAGALLAEAALSFRPAVRWGLWAVACGGAAGWLLAR